MTDEVERKVPSIENYPEDTNPEYLMGINEQGGKVKVPKFSGGGLPEYALGWRSSDYGTNFSTNNPVYWNKKEFNSDDILMGSGEVYGFKLTSGKAYKLTGYVALRDDSNTLFMRRFRWYNVSEGKWLGSEGGFYSGYSSYTAAGSGPAIAYVNLDATSSDLFELRCTYSSGDVDYFTFGTSFEINVLG